MLKSLVDLVESPEELRVIATPWESSDPTWKDARGIPCPPVRITTFAVFLLESCVEWPEWLIRRFRLSPWEDEEDVDFVEELLDIAMSIFGEVEKTSVLLKNSPEFDDSIGTVVKDKG